MTILEGASKKLYHYCGINQLKKMISTDKFFFNDFEKDYTNGYYSFSTTRQRNSKMGFPAMSRHYGGGLKNSLFNSFLIRLELDGETVQNLQYDYRNKHYGVKVKPFDYLWYDLADEEPRLNGKEYEMRAITDDYYDDEAQEQQYSQAEDRILSKKKNIVGFKKCLKRIDAYFDLQALFDNVEEIRPSIEAILYLRQLMYEGITVNFYVNQDAFNIQANKTVPVEVMLDKLKTIDLNS